MKGFFLTTLLSLALGAGLWAQESDWHGKLEVGPSSITMVFHLGEDNGKLDVPDQGAKDIPMEVSLSPMMNLKISIPVINARYEGLMLGNKIVGTFTQHGQSFPLTLMPGLPQIRRPQTPTPPFPYSTEEVSFRNGDALLRGTLVLPEGCTKDTPAVVFVTGSGLQNRDEEIYSHKPFAVLADALARAGIASMRYDDRGFGQSTGDVVNATTEDLKNDAMAGVLLMRERFNKVGVLGHSEGGAIALMLASEGKTDFIVSLAGAVISMKETLIWQNRRLLYDSGYSDEVVDEYCKALSEVFDSAINGTHSPSVQGYDLPPGMKTNLEAVGRQCSTPYMRYLLKMDLTDSLGRVTCPVLALNGSLDVQVWGERNLSVLKERLPSTPGNSIHGVEGLNHLFQHCKTGTAEEYKDIEETISPEVLSEIVTWVNGL